MKKIIIGGLVLAGMLGFCSCGNSSVNTDKTDNKVNELQKSYNDDTLYQTALLQSLTQGYYDGYLTVADLKKSGDFGIGTFDAVDGELIMLDGIVYQALSDGSIEVASDDTKIPFSDVTKFDEDFKLNLKNIKNINVLKEELDKSVKEHGKNNFYAVKMNGKFDKMQVRSEYAQTSKPYRPLEEVMATDQVIFDYEDISGTLVGLYCPDYINDLNVSGWHFHFISDDKAKGGHILELSAKELEVKMDLTDKFEMIIPDTEDFQNMDLAKDVESAVKKVETNE